jgi:hypothetical protein
MFSCIWYVQAKISKEDSWVKTNDLEGSTNYDLYVAAYYWVTYTVVTVGYGDIIIHNSVLQKIIACFLMVIGVFFYSFMIGNFSSQITNSDDVKSNKKKI